MVFLFELHLILGSVFHMKDQFRQCLKGWGWVVSYAGATGHIFVEIFLEVPKGVSLPGLSPAKKGDSQAKSRDLNFL